MMYKLLKIAEEESERSIESYRNYVILSLLATTGLRTIEVESNVSDLSYRDKNTSYMFAVKEETIRVNM